MSGMDAIDPVTTPHHNRASDSHPVMHNPLNEARRAYKKRYGDAPPKGWPYTDDEVKEANKLIGIVEVDDRDKGAAAMRRLNG